MKKQNNKKMNLTEFFSLFVVLINVILAGIDKNIHSLIGWIGLLVVLAIIVGEKNDNTK